MDNAAPDLMALIGSRICHDLISPIGAISNGVELLAMSGTAPGPEMSLIAESVAAANARIRFFRVAFGGGGADQRIGRTEVGTILTDYTHGGRTQVAWNSDTDLSRGDVKLVFLAILCLETAMPFGGRIRVEQAARRWLVAGASAKLRPDPMLWERLALPEAEPGLTAAQVQFALIGLQLRATGRRLLTDIGAEEIRLNF
jgi:histidine phosphotransferase ChpT